MSLNGTLYNGVSGLKSNTTSLNVIGDNIANVNTVGFKYSRTNFSDLLSNHIVGGGGWMQKGNGVKVQNIEQIFTSGSLKNTGKVTDLAISGKGFFVVKGMDNGVEQNFYTRAGQFQVNKEGYLSTSSNMRLQGYSVGEDGNLLNSMGDININATTLEPRATEKVAIKANLNAAAPPLPLAPTYDQLTTNPGEKSSFSTTITVYDSRGEAHQLEVHFAKLTDKDSSRGDMTSAAPEGTAETWNFHVLAKKDELDASSIDANNSGKYQQIAQGSLDFNSEGELISINKAIQNALSPSKGMGGSVTFKSAKAQNIEFDFAGEKPLGALESGNVAITDSIPLGGTAVSNHGADESKLLKGQIIDDGNGNPMENRRQVVVYDKNGRSHTLEVVYAKTDAAGIQSGNAPAAGETAVNFYVLAKTDELAANHPNKSNELYTKVAGGTLIFDSATNQYKTAAYDSVNKNGSDEFSMAWDGVDLPPANVKFDFSNSTSNAGASLTQAYTQDGSGSSGNGITNFAAENTVRSQDQNGYATGFLQNISVDPKGVITGGFSNGENRMLGRLALAMFQNETALEKGGNNLWKESTQSGEALIGSAGSGGRGSILSSTLEQSNVDLAEQFINMISAQRGFSAASKTITTTDQMMREVTMMKR